MGSKSKTLALILMLICITVPYVLPFSSAVAQSVSKSAPAIEWQKEYGDLNIEAVSNLIQTSDEGFEISGKCWNRNTYALSAKKSLL